MKPPDRRQHLVIVGGGHAHVSVLKSFAMRPEPGLRLTLVSPASYATYSGMVPGVIAGQYRLREAQIDVRALAARAGAAFIPDRVVRIDATARRIELETRPPLPYDLLSIDIGSRPAAQERVASASRVAMVKPIEVAAHGIEAALKLPPPPAGRRVVVVGAGPGGVEIAFALAARLRAEGQGSITLCDAAPEPASTRGQNTVRAVARALAQHRIDFLGGTGVSAVDGQDVVLADGRVLQADLIVWATGAAGPPLLAASDLPVDSRGFLRVGDDLRCEAHPQIFAAGDCATLASHPELPKAGVYAVRQGPLLARNLRAAARGKRRLRPYRPQKGFLALLNTGEGRAILSWGRIAWHSRLAWLLKDRIDRSFIRRYAQPGLAPDARMSREMIPCGGCAAKVGADILGRVLARLPYPPAEGVIVGLHDADDAAVFAHPPGTLAVATVDVFPPFADDLYVVGQVAATNAASDLYAMGAEGSAAVAVVSLPEENPGDDEARLEHFLRGAIEQLGRLGIPLVGGHTIAGEQALLGFAMHGCVHPDRILRKAGARPGDALVLTKALGTGVVLAAARAGFAAADWVEAALASMRRSNGPAMRILQSHAARACTDVTGFGLLGHLSELLRASQVGAKLNASQIPALPGARELLAAGWRSSFHHQNVRSLGAATAPPAGEPETLALYTDPQTSGGLLAAIPAERLADLRSAFAAAAEELHVIGECTAGPPRWELVET
jgi:selenide,water dikinase